MAEVIVKLLIDHLIPLWNAEILGLLKDKIPSLLINEIKLAKDVQNQLKSVADQLLLIKAYLKDADKQAQAGGKNGELLKEWVRQMREVSFRIEDAIDEYLFVMNNELLEKDMCGIIGVVVSYICDFLRGIMPRHKILEQLKGIKESLEDLEASKIRYGINPESNSGGGSDISNSSSLHSLRMGARFIDEPVGVDHTKKKLTDWLLEGESPRTVIAIVGEGGLGKTTIVNIVFEELKREKKFDCHAFITVSRSLGGNDLLKTLIKSINGDADNDKIETDDTSGQPLQTKLREYLEKKKYMIVFDDVWQENFWGEVEYALPKKQGRIIITTRHQKVAVFCRSRTKPVQIHSMEGLDPNDAWELFCRNAFTEGNCPEHLKKLAEKLVKKCNGVPLSIMAMACLLKEKGFKKWKEVYKNLGSHLSSDLHLNSVHQVLSESYHDLNYCLKSCLLHFGLFPEDYSIRCSRLINIWTTGGFIENKGSQTQEEVAEDHLMELIARSLVKVDEVSPRGKVRSCRVHDLTHEFLLEKCKELNLFLKENSEEFKSHEQVRHLSINSCIDGITMKNNTTNYELVRSCFILKNAEEDPTSSLELLCSNFKLLVRLDCERVPLYSLPTSVGNLFHLKYLNLKHTRIQVIPEFIANLRNLETLNVKYTEIHEIPPEINKLIKLRHLLCRRRGPEPYIHPNFKEGIENLTALQNLGWVNVSCDEFIRELKNLKQLRSLRIRCLGERNLELLCSAIESMEHLCKLTIVTEAVHVLDLESLTQPPQDLEYLHLEGKVGKLPRWFAKLESLVRLHLMLPGLTEDPLPLLQNLSNLSELHLYKYEGSNLYCQKGGFMNLKTLKIHLHQYHLKTLVVDEGAMPLLQQFVLTSYPNETLDVPARIKQLIISSFRKRRGI